MSLHLVCNLVRPVFVDPVVVLQIKLIVERLEFFKGDSSARIMFKNTADEYIIVDELFECLCSGIFCRKHAYASNAVIIVCHRRKQTGIVQTEDGVLQCCGHVGIPVTIKGEREIIAVRPDEFAAVEAGMVCNDVLIRLTV